MEKKNVRFPIAAVLLSIAALLNLVVLMVNMAHTPPAYLLNAYGLPLLRLLVNGFLCAVLFMKKRDNLLLVASGSQMLVQLLMLLRGFSTSGLLVFAAYLLLTALILVLGEQTLINVDLSQYKSLAGKLVFLPAVATLLSFRAGNVLILLNWVLSVAGLLMLGLWLKDPYAQESAAPAAHTDDGAAVVDCDAYCSLGKHILLCLFTCGIWSLIWTYRTTKFLNNAPDAQQYNPTSKLLLCMFVPFYQIYWFYKHGQRLDAMSKQRNVSGSEMATMCLILAIFIPIVACILIQDRINTICTAKAAPVTKQPAADAADQLKKYKELLDAGAITQEEFDAKKKQLLEL